MAQQNSRFWVGVEPSEALLLQPRRNLEHRALLDIAPDCAVGRHQSGHAEGGGHFCRRHF